MKILGLYIFYLVPFFIICSELNDYAKIKNIVNEVDECSEEDVEFMNNYVNKMYWVWTNNFFRYLKLKAYIYENDIVYDQIIKMENIIQLLTDDFIIYRNKEEFIRSALTILSNEKHLKNVINTYVPRNKIKFFQDLSEQEIIKLFIDEKNNVINSFKNIKKIEEFRDVANSKYYYHKKMLENKREEKVDDTVVSEKKENHNDEINNNGNIKHAKNVIIFSISDILTVKPMSFDFYDKNKWSTYFYFSNDEERITIENYPGNNFSNKSSDIV
ncbi:conserved Plasmodium protein, unknown function [Plasmodium berghei]|uniref:Fam-b protein n=2 Tax=Plasmodium berghei TaxID=5821 RepID=A0A509AP17_PLABA|nr:conserved Plasmodium protein, unknown function [Plasmodium berghei ANKA]CXI63582.1 conserved Plasmodium protein, unknown function [Plasmodium berghei]SCM23806.1 conserved Plasmodium protein, unknown function [Plasmodium berghei]SCN26784.1 conserved Plasmodium protein, unknown function [Plasmodium berghei]SCO61125.1 conserved Plasmodium protein, unknown function [Plasmodium berghei]SCO63203.1 conserved Plasmodium protein, unknown function [Plasmodium berghei]|eukprot:XP_034422401.1 conserved Plasmodium protein, unknown function [Plasmodium berghei ANKA]